MDNGSPHAGSVLPGAAPVVAPAGGQGRAKAAMMARALASDWDALVAAAAVTAAAPKIGKAHV